MVLGRIIVEEVAVDVLLVAMVAMATLEIAAIVDQMVDHGKLMIDRL